MATHGKKSPQYPVLLSKYLGTQEGTAFAVHILSQLIKGFDTDSKNHIKKVHLDTDSPLVLDFIDKE